MNRLVHPRRRGASRRLLLALLAALALIAIAAILLRGAIFPQRPQSAAFTQPDADAIREHNAETLFRSARSAAEAANWPLAHSELTRLREDWSHTRFYANNRAAIEALAKAIESAPTAKALLPPPPPSHVADPHAKGAIEKGGPPPKPDYETVFLFRRGEQPEPPIPDPDDAPDAWRRHVADLMQKEITFDFVETPVQDVVNFLPRLLVDMTIVLDPGTAKGLPAITLRGEKMPFQGALEQVCKQSGLAHADVNGAILLATEARFKRVTHEFEDLRLALKPPNKGAADRLAKKITFDFVTTPLPDVLNFLSSLLDLAIVFDAKLMKDAPVLTLRVIEMRLDRSLSWIGLVTGLSTVWRDGALFVSSRERIKAALAEDEALRPAQQPPTAELAEKLAKRTKFDFVETPWPDVVAFLADLVKVPLVVDTEEVDLKDTPNVTLRAGDMHADAAIRWCCRVSGLACLWRDGKLVVTTPERALREAEKRKGQKGPKGRKGHEGKGTGG